MIEDARYAAGAALYALRRYQQIQELLRTMACEDKKRESALFKRTIKRIKEQESGSYNLAAMHFHDGENKNPYKDNATYVGPVAVKDSPGRGRGLFLTKAVKAGDLLLCEKAFAYSYLSENLYEGPNSRVTVLYDSDTGLTTVTSEAALLRAVVRKLV